MTDLRSMTTNELIARMNAIHAEFDELAREMAQRDPSFQWEPREPEIHFDRDETPIEFTAEDVQHDSDTPIPKR